MNKYVALACISAVSLTVVAWVAGEQMMLFAAGLMVLYLTKRERMACFLLVANMTASTFVIHAVRWLPHTYDAALWRIDVAMGFNPAIPIMTLASMPWLIFVTKGVYYGCTLAVALALVVSHDGVRLVARALTASWRA